MEKTTTEHLQLLSQIVNPEARTAYYKAHINPAVINLSPAENILLLDLYQGHDLGRIDESVLRYPHQIYGSNQYRESIRQFLEAQWGVTSISYNNIFGVSGVSSALENLAFALFELEEIYEWVLKNTKMHIISNETAELNRLWQNKLTGIVWENYMLINTQWQTAAEGFTVNIPTYLSNTTMETYIQVDKVGTCIGCHADAITTTDQDANFSFLLGRAK